MRGVFLLLDCCSLQAAVPENRHHFLDCFSNVVVVVIANSSWHEITDVF